MKSPQEIREKEARLQQQIKDAFKDVPYPGDNNIGLPGGRDDSENVIELFRGQDWRDQKSNELWAGALYWMTPEAFHYYFPAYLLAALEMDSVDVATIVFTRITPPDIEYVQHDNFEERFNLFTSVQKQTIVGFLDFELDEMIIFSKETKISTSKTQKEIHTLLDYWNKF